jgi:hypothetical protein
MTSTAKVFALVPLLFLISALAISCGAGSPAPGDNAQRDPVQPPPTQNGAFTIVVLPDTQCYTSLGSPLEPETCGGVGNMEMFHAQTDWVARNKGSQNIRAVIGVGDIVQCGTDQLQWERADAAYDRLDPTGIPYLPVAGNLDYDSACGDDLVGSRPLANHSRFFGPERFAQYTWYGGRTLTGGSNDNFFVTFESGSHRFLILAIEFFPRDVALTWAQEVLDAHPDRLVIITTHSFLTDRGTRVNDADPEGPRKYGLIADNNAEEMWEKFIRKSKNIVAVVNGHTGGTAHRVDPADDGHLVAQMLANYQHSGGQGYLRLLKFVPAKHEIEVRTYSPYRDRFRDEADDQFTVSYGKP